MNNSIFGPRGTFWCVDPHFYMWLKLLIVLVTLRNYLCVQITQWLKIFWKRLHYLSGEPAWSGVNCNGGGTPPLPGTGIVADDAIGLPNPLCGCCMDLAGAVTKLIIQYKYFSWFNIPDPIAWNDSDVRNINLENKGIVFSSCRVSIVWYNTGDTISLSRTTRRSRVVLR